MNRFAYVLVASATGILTGCAVGGTPPAGGEYAEKIVGKWEMVEDPEHPRHNAPTETIEFTRAGGFVLRMNNKVELDGRFRVEKDKLILTHSDGRTRRGDPVTIKRLTAHSLILRSAAGKETEFVRK